MTISSPRWGPSVTARSSARYAPRAPSSAGCSTKTPAPKEFRRTAVIGAGVGFLWFNTYPAMVFMGDVGSLALGGGLGALAVVTKTELVSLILGGVFVVETVSVIAQVAVFKTTGKRIFLMAPIHHHFEKKGWPEPRVIVRFWIISMMLALVALAQVKLR